MKNLNNIPLQCKNALEWYERHPTYKGEYVRVYEYCKTYAKDVSPQGFEANPILSDLEVWLGLIPDLVTLFIKV